MTRDLFKDFGAQTISGISLTPLSGGDGLFDHILLGRSVADLDRATAAALLKDTPKSQTAARMRQQWLDLGNPDHVVAGTAVWEMVAGRGDSLPYLAKSITIPEKKVAVVDEGKVQSLIEGLHNERQAVRAAAADELLRLGDGTLPHLRKAAAGATGEAKARLAAMLNLRDAKASPDEIRLRKCLTILSAIGTPEALELRAKIEKALPRVGPTLTRHRPK